MQPQEITYEQKQNLLKQQKRTLWVKEQKFIKTKIKQFNDFQWKLQDLRYIAGVDISFSGKFENGASAALVVFDTKYNKLVYENYEYVKLLQPYIPGFLAFRQLPPTLHLFEKLKQTHPEYWPQLIMVDGNGIVHKFKCGYACHLGVVLDIPTIGCAKTFFDIDGLHQQQIQDMLCDTLTKTKEHMKLKGKSGKEWCTAILTDPNQNHHLYVSVGTKISLDTATQIVMKYLKNQTPEPVLIADRNSRKKIKQMTHEHYLNAPSYEMKFLAP